MEKEDYLNVGFLDDDEQNAFLEDTAAVVAEKDDDDAKEEETQQEDVTEDSTETKEPESVGNEEDTDEYEDTEPNDEGSPNVTSIAQAFQEIGVLQTLDNDKISSIKTSEDLADAVEAEVRNRMDFYTRRVTEAMNAQVPVSAIQQMESTLRWLDGINDETIENEENEELRARLIYGDLLNKGHSDDEAKELVSDYINSGKDVDKAKKALETAKRVYSERYSQMIEDGKTAQKEHQKRVKKQLETLKTSIMEDDKMFSQLEIPKATRTKILNAVMTPSETMEDGRKVTPVFKFQQENPETYLKMMGMFYVLTDGFTNIDNLAKGRVKKEVRKGIDKLTQVLNTTQRANDGSLKLKSGVSSDFNPFDDLTNITLG